MKRILLLDVGNTNTHVGLADADCIVRRADIPTAAWKSGAPELLLKFIGRATLEGAVFCSVVPATSPRVTRFVERRLGIPCLQLTYRNISGVGIDYPKPQTIGADRLANAMAATSRFGAPCVVVDFGTAVTFDVVDRDRNYVGGIIAPGLAAMTTYLHEKTALLPVIKIKETRSVIGKSTEEAMLIGAVQGYRGLIKELLAQLRSALGVKRLPVILTGGYAKLIAAGLPQVTAVEPDLTLEGLRLLWKNHS